MKGRKFQNPYEVLQGEPSASGRLKVVSMRKERYWKLIFPRFVNGYRLAIGYSRKVRGKGVTPPSFLGGLRDWGL